MKARLSLFIALIMMLEVIFSVSVFAADAQQVILDDETQLLLFSLGILDDEDDLSVEMTRGRFAKAAVKLSGSSVPEYEGVQVFYDVGRNHENYSDIMAAFQLGLMNGRDGGFYPDETIKVSEAVKVMVVLSGRKEVAEQRGGYPNGYYLCATQMGLSMKEYEFDAPLTAGAFARLAADTLNAPMLVITSIGEGVTMTEDPSRTLLSECHKIYRTEGIVKENSAGSLSEAAISDKYFIRIGDRKFMCEDDTYDGLLGYYATAYYRNSDGLYKLVTAAKNKRRTTEYTFSSFNVDKFNSEEILVYNENRKTAFQLNDVFYVIYNGQTLPVFNQDTFKKGKKNITILDNNDDSSYDVAIIEEYTHMIVGHVDAESMRIFDKEKSGEDIYLPDNGNVRVSMKNMKGKNIKLRTIKNNDVLTIKSSDDGSLISVLQSNVKISGNVTGVGADRETKEKYIEINGERYNICKSLEDRTNLALSVGDSGEFWLSAENEIAYFLSGPLENDVIYGCVTGCNNPDGMGETLTLKIFDENGNWNLINCRTKIIIDGVTYKKPEEAKVPLSDFSDGPYLIRYRVNNEGLITKIDICKNSDTIVYPYTGSKDWMRYKNTIKSFEGKINVNDKTRVFIAPENRIGEEILYSAGKSEILVHDRVYRNVVAYREGNGMFVDAVMIMNADTTTIDENTGVALVTGIGAALDADGEAADALYVLKDGVEQVVLSDVSDYFETNDIAEGDIVRYECDPNGYMNMMEKVYDYSKKAASVTSDMSDSFTGVFRIMEGYVVRRDDNVVQLAKNTVTDLSAVIENVQTENLTLDKYAIYRYDRDEKSGTMITASSVNDYTTTGNMYDYAVAYTRNGEPKMLVVYQAVGWR